MEEEAGITRLPIPSRGRGLVHAETDSECDDPALEKIIEKFKEIKSKSKTSDLGDYLSLPKDLNEIKLSAKLETGIDDKDLYLKKEGDLVVPNFKKKNVKSEDYSGAALAEIKPHIGKKKMKKLKKAEREKTKGSDWYNMPALEMTEERQRDLELLQMRGVLDPKRFYKKNATDTLPKYYQIGTVVDTAADFYTDRVPKKDRKQTMVDELLADAEFKKFQKRKYIEIIEDKSKKQGKKFFKKKKA